jgi:hypothetical protein
MMEVSLRSRNLFGEAPPVEACTLANSNPIPFDAPVINAVFFIMLKVDFFNVE